MIRKPRKKFGGALGEAFDELWEAVEAGQIVESDSMTVEKTTRGTVVRARGGGEIGEDGEDGVGQNGATGPTGATGPVGESTNSIYIVTHKRLLTESDFFFNHSSEGMTSSGHSWWIFDREKVQWNGSAFENFYYPPAVAIDGHEPAIGPAFPTPIEPFYNQGEYNLMADTSDAFALNTAGLTGYYSGIATEDTFPILMATYSYGFTYFDYQQP